MLKNYTSTVPVERTVARIEMALAKAGAGSIVKNYDAVGRLTALMFKIELPGTASAREVTIRLPVNISAVYEVMTAVPEGARRRRPNRGHAAKAQAQAERTAWKLMQDWVEVQLSLIQLKQTDVLEVFLAHVWDGNETLYARLKQGGYKALAEHVL